MISIEEAKKWVFDKTFVLEEEIVSIDQSVGRILSQDVLATMNIPSFRNSAMDGYALLRQDLENGNMQYELKGEIQAGKSDATKVERGKAYRIFTGAVLPINADIVVIQEKTEEKDGQLLVLNYKKEDKSNIRLEGEQIRTGEVALKAGHLINAASIGLLASFGIDEIPVYRKPKVGIITTGNELKRIGEKLELGEIYESNSYSLKSALDHEGFSDHKEITVGDNISQTTNDIGLLLKSCDVLIMSGGISVGKYDFVKEALEKNGVDEVFYKIKQKPGKPMYFGVKQEKIVFALPGNPASLLVCFYEYVLPALRKMVGDKYKSEIYEKEISSDYNYSGMRPEFLRGKIDEEKVQILEGQSSFMLKSFAEANCLIYIHGDKRLVKKGSRVEVHPIY